MSDKELLELGLKIRADRRSTRLSMAQLAALVKCHPKTIYRIERGLHDPSYSLVEAIKKALAEQEKGGK